MQKKHLFFAGVALISGLSALFFNACDKDTDCYVKVNVVDIVTDSLNNTDTLPVSGAYVKIDIDSSMVNAEGKTNAAGIFSTVFTAPAIFNIAVKYTVLDTPTYDPSKFDVYRRGSNTIRLKEGDTVFSTVILEKDTIRESKI
jgi:hypothetical protein